MEVTRPGGQGLTPAGSCVSSARMSASQFTLVSSGSRSRFCPLFRQCLDLLILLAGLMAWNAHALDWPRWRGPDLNGISKETGWLATWPAEGPKQLWKANVGIGFSSIAVSQGRAYTMGNQANQDTVFCFDAETGKEVWKHTYPAKLGAQSYEGGPHATPTVEAGRVYTLSKWGEIVCLDGETGKSIWSKNVARESGAKVPTWGFAGSVLVQGDTLYVNVGKAGMALAKADGKILWNTGPEPAGYATPVPITVGGQAALAVFGSKALFALDPKTGKELWSHPWKTSWDVNAADPILQGDALFISSGYDHGGALLRLGGGAPSVVWEKKDMRNHYNSCVLLDGHLYGFDEKGDLRCLDWSNGAVKWSESSLKKKDQQGSLMAADGKLIALGPNGELVIAEATPAGFKPISRAQVLDGKCWTMPVLANGRLYCRNAAGDLVCLDVKGR